MVDPVGFEPTTSCLWGWRDCPLLYPASLKIGISAAGSPNQARMLLVSEMTVTIMGEELLHILPTDRVCCMQMETKEREVV